MKLRVRNNWENYEWTVNGKSVDARKIDSVVIDGRDYNVRAVKKRNTVYEHGRIYEEVTYDLEIEGDVADVTVWVSLYDNEKILKKVTDVSLKDNG